MAQEISAQSPLEVRLRSLWDLSGRELAARAWKWPKEERAMLAKEFRAYLESGKFGKPEGDEPFSILIQLGDREATKVEVQKMVAQPSRYGSSLDVSGSPIVIEYLAPYAFSQEPYSESRVTDVITAPFSFLVTHDIFEILSDSTAFTGEVTNWARMKARDPESQRAELQRWWQENKIHFEQESYKAVKPGRPIPSVFEVVDENRRKAGLPPLEDLRPKPPIPMPLPTTPQPAPAPLPAAEGSHSSNALYYIAAAMATLLVAGLAIAAGRKRGNRGK